MKKFILFVIVLCSTLSVSKASCPSGFVCNDQLIVTNLFLSAPTGSNLIHMHWVAISPTSFAPYIDMNFDANGTLSPASLFSIPGGGIELLGNLYIQGNINASGTVSGSTTILWQTNVVNVTVTNAQTANFAKTCTGLGYTNIYRALISQTPTGGAVVPTAVVLENTFGAPLVWARVSMGGYTITLANAFAVNKTFVRIQNPIAYTGVQCTVNGITSNTITIYQCGSTGASIDGYFGFGAPTPIEILVYP